MKNILIIGCGYVGQELARLFVKEGVGVYGVNRSVPEDAIDCVNYLEADVLDKASFKNFPKEVDAIVYAIGAKESSEKAYDEAYVQGLSNVVDFAKENYPKLKRIIFTSSTGVYGQSMGEEVDEASFTVPQNFSGKKVLEGEELLLTSGVPATVIRFGGIYGPSRTRLINKAKEGPVEITINDLAYTNRIHRDDCARVVKHILELEDPDRIYNAVDNNPATKDTVMSWIADQVGSEIRYVGDFELSSPSKLNKRIQNKKLRDSGFKFQYPSFREGYDSLLKD